MQGPKWSLSHLTQMMLLASADRTIPTLFPVLFALPFSASNELYKAGMIPIRFGQVFVKGQAMQTGQCPVSSYNR